MEKKNFIIVTWEDIRQDIGRDKIGAKINCSISAAHCSYFVH